MASGYGHAPPDRATLRRRVAGVVLALAAEALLIVMLLTLAPYASRGPEGGRPMITISLPPSPSPERTSRQRTTRAAREAATAPPAKATPPPPVETPPVPWTLPPNVMEVTKEVFAATDIGKIRSAPREAATASDAAAGEPGAGDSQAVGTGPNGETLYAAEWVREPTDAQLSYYLPRRPVGPGWGIIACRTVARFKVADCVPLGEGPGGSGYARSIQEAAWQFLVRPPRVGGKTMVGAWVRIRIDYSQRAAGSGR